MWKHAWIRCSLSITATLTGALEVESKNHKIIDPVLGIYIIHGDSKYLQKSQMFFLLLLEESGSTLGKGKNELHQVAQQASNIEDLTEVIRASLSVMSKQWSNAMHTFHEKIDSLSSLIHDHGLDSTPQEEFLSLTGGGRTSPSVHQFLVNSLGEVVIRVLNGYQSQFVGLERSFRLLFLNIYSLLRR